MKSSTPDQPTESRHFKLLLMGQAGTRKTWLMLQFPGIHVIDCDHNLEGPARYLRDGPADERTKQPVKGKGILPTLSYTFDDSRCDDSGNVLETHECYERVLSLVDRLIPGDPRHPVTPEYEKVRTIGLDSISHVQEFIKYVIYKKQEIEMLDFRNWSDFASKAYLLFIARLDATKRTIIATCHETMIYEPPKKETMGQKIIKGYEPMFPGQVGDNLGAFFTDVWRMEVRQASAGRNRTIIQTDKTPLCNVLKNSCGMPPEVDVTEGFKTIEPYLKGRI